MSLVPVYSENNVPEPYTEDEFPKLDLSSNKIEDISEIQNLVDTMKSINANIILSNQVVTKVTMVALDESEDSNGVTEVEVELPLILKERIDDI